MENRVDNQDLARQAEQAFGEAQKRLHDWSVQLQKMNEDAWAWIPVLEDMNKSDKRIVSAALLTLLCRQWADKE